MHGNLHALGGNFGGQGVGGACGVAVHAAVQHNNRLFFGFAAAPQVILANEPAQILAPHGTVQRGNGLDGQGGGLFQHSLHLHAVLAHNVGIIAAGIVQPFAGKVYLVSEQGALQGTKGAKSIGAEQGAGGGVKGHHHFRPVYHGGHHKGQLVLAQVQRVALFYHQGIVNGGAVGRVVHLQHGQGFGVHHQAQVRPAHQHGFDHGGVVRLHVVHDQIVQLAAIQGGGNVLQELCANAGIGSVQQGGFLVQNHIGVVADAARNGKQVFKLCQAAVTCADINCIFGYSLNALHEYSSVSVEIVENILND